MADGHDAVRSGEARADHRPEAHEPAPEHDAGRAGLHTGEVELAGDDVRGIAVHIGARVAAQAQPGEVLVSQTVTDLVAGSGLEFEPKASVELKGVPGEWRLLAATPPGDRFAHG